MIEQPEPERGDEGYTPPFSNVLVFRDLTGGATLGLRAGCTRNHSLVPGRLPVEPSRVHRLIELELV